MDQFDDPFGFSRPAPSLVFGPEKCQPVYIRVVDSTRHYRGNNITTQSQREKRGIPPDIEYINNRNVASQCRMVFG